MVRRQRSSLFLLAAVSVVTVGLRFSDCFVGSKHLTAAPRALLIREAGAGYLQRHGPKEPDTDLNLPGDPPLVDIAAAAGAIHEIEFKKRPSGIFRYAPGIGGKGAQVMDVIDKSRYPGDPTGQAHIAGVQEGWVIKSINGVDVTGFELDDIMDILDDEVFMGMHQALTGTSVDIAENKVEKAELPLNVVFQEIPGWSADAR